MKPLIFFLSSFLLTSCVAPPQQVTPQIINVYVTSAAHPWLSELYDCATPSEAVNLSGPQSAEISLRLGEPANLITPTYQIGSEDILVVMHPQSGVGSLTLDQAQSVFSGRITNWKDVGGNDLPIQVWTFSSGEDAQAIFDQTVMRREPVTSLARLAVSAQAMSDGVGTVPGSVGFLPRRWKAGNTREAIVVATVPVLALTASTPTGAVQELLACLQSGK